ncbi:hypothetical protein RhiXN_11156 [Rhizoctonia solani]|uniref:Uncharacterized protein n=1 Tax=Rhizoctonia solani TaxID=456999 RepID=A0A8H8T283_9AGAM|nr:uncharacterized protein RhiXN_11156 [Rhizoctonia solani]QRW26079.1 hypothetical protein RhiXN_11156 [Rhizoctonia solani]
MSNSSEVNVKFIIDTAEGGIISDTHSLSPVVSASAPKPVPQQTSASSTCQTRRAAAQNPTSVNISRSHDFARSFVTFPLANLPTARHRLKLGNYLLLPYRLKSQTTFERYPPQSFSDY